MFELVPRVGVYVGCALLIGTLSLGLFLGLFESLGLAILAALIVLVFGVWLLVRCAWRPSLAKWRKEALPIGVVIGASCLAPFAHSVQWDLYFFARRGNLESLANDVLAYGKIQEMSDGLRYRKSVNGQEFDASNREVGKVAIPALDVALRVDNIDPAKYHEFRKRLVATGFCKIEVKDQYVAFLYDGLVDNLVGVLWVRPNQSLPATGSTVFNTDLVSLRELAGKWYAFGST